MNNKTNPDHYFTSTGAEVIDIAECLDFCLGNVIKYVCRAGNKPGEPLLDDLEKAKWYLDRVIERETKKFEQTTTTPSYRHSP